MRHHSVATGLFAVAILLQACAIRADDARPLVLADDGRSTYSIVIAADAAPPVRHAADELRAFLRQMTGADLPIVTDATPAADHEIVLGPSARLQAVAPDIDLTALGSEGYRLRTVGSRLVLAGSPPRGVLYAVYGLLDDHFGCRWFTPALSKIPTVKRLTLDPLDETKTPALEYRSVLLFDCYDQDWCVRNRVNVLGSLDEAHGGQFGFVPGYFVHTWQLFIPPEKHFADHPEYFAMIDGKRVADKSQICPTRPDVAKIVTERVRQLLKEHPEARVISVSQNDANKNYCQCPVCAALDEKEGTHAAQVLYLANQVAEAIEKDFPDRAVETLAYEWSRKPPKTMKPRPNLIIRLCTIRCSFSEPLAASDYPQNRSFRRDLEGWSAISNRLWIWDYTTYFSYYPIPFPNWRVLDDNIRFFIQNHVRGILEQDNWQSPNGELAGLSGYLLSRYLWNPDYDQERAISEYLDAAFGPAAPHVRAYIDLLADHAEKQHIPVGIYGSRTPKWLEGDILDRADKLWDQATAAVTDRPDCLERVRIARLSCDYAIIERYRFKPDGMITYDGNPRRGKVKAIDPGYAARIRRFLDVSARARITHIREGQPDYAEYRQWLLSLFPPDQPPETGPTSDSTPPED